MIKSVTMFDRVSQCSPEELSQTDFLIDECGILLGGPSVGKSHHLRKVENVSIISSLSEIESEIPEGVVVIDDFYYCYQEYLECDHEERQRNFEEILSMDSGLYLSTRPFDLEWLLTNTR